MMKTSLSPNQAAYLQEYISTVAGFRLLLDKFESDLIVPMFNAITRQEEAENRHRDQWGNWEGSFCEAFIERNITFPWVDEIIIKTVERVRKTEQNLPIFPKYPDNHKFAVCITHDTDDINSYQNISAFSHAFKRFLQCGSVSKDAIKLILLKTLKEIITQSRKKLSLNDFYRFVELEAQYGFKSTFFCFAPEISRPQYYDSFYRYSDEVIYNQRRMSLTRCLQEIASSGWEVGLHGSYNSALDLDSLAFEQLSMERILNMPVRSIRQHWLHFDFAKTTVMQDKLKLSADSTLGFNRFIGFRAGIAHPFKVWNTQLDSALSILEVPMIIMDGALFYANSLELSEELALKYCIRLLDRVEQIGGVLTINWHNGHLHKPKFFHIFKELLKEASLRKAWGCSMAELTNHWLAYHKLVNNS
jgi:hypothetical protein